MAYEMKEGDISIFVNDKEGNDARPDYTGKALIDGTEMRVAMWKTQSAGGNTFLSGKVEEKGAYNGSAKSARNTVSNEVPF